MNPDIKTGEKDMGYILALDQGTSTTTALIVDKNGKIIGLGSTDYPQHYPQPGYVEHVASDIKRSVEQSIIKALAASHIKPQEISAIGITNQRETTCLFDQSSNTDYPFIVWQCRRSMPICQDMKARKWEERIHQRTGLHIDPYFSASKLMWYMENEPKIRKKLENKELLFGTIDTFLCHWLSGGDLHITDVTNASRTMLMDIRTCQWSEECLDLFSVPKNCLPSITRSTGPFGKTKGLSFLPDGIPIAAIAGDQQAALFGQTCFNKGEIKATFGTGCFILLNTGEEPVFSKHGLLTSVAYQIDNKPVYCLEGSAFIAGAAVQFLIDAFSLVNKASEIEALAASVEDSDGVIFVPALCGLGAPYWQPDVRGSFTGLSRGTTKGHIARATLEGIALQNTDIMLAMADDAIKPTMLKVDGGASENNLLMQLQADFLGVSCVRAESAQKTALGIAYMAGLAIGMYSGLDQIASFNHDGPEFVPQKNNGWAEKKIRAYRAALGKL